MKPTHLHPSIHLLACALLLAAAEPAAAQRFRFPPTLHRPSFYRPPVVRPVAPVRPVVTYPHWGYRPYHYWVYHHGYPYRWGYPVYVNLYTYPYSSPYPVYFPLPMPVPDYGSGYAPTVIQNLYQSPAGSIDPIGDTPHTAVLPPPQDNTAVVAVMLPSPNAEVWFDGHKTSSTGSTRVFTTPPLEPGKKYHYTVRAEWDEGGRRRRVERTVEVSAGQVSEVDFTRDDGRKQENRTSQRAS